MILAILLLLSGLSISVVAIYYSVMGLMAIFSAAAIPIAIMGVSLEIGKLVTASWIKAHWHRLPLLMKTYAVAAVAILMVITSLGIFGYLSKAHSDQTLVSGDVQAKVAIYDERIKTEKDNIEADRKQIAQMDAAVDQVLSRSDDEKGASKANEIRRSQLKDRSRLQNEILASQKKIATIQDERAPFAAENRKVEAEVGPIKYIAAFVYGANPDANILERAVTWVIILIVIVFDPLAVVMLLASQMTFQWHREEKQAKYEQDEGPLTVDQIEQIKSREAPELTPDQTELYSETFPTLDEAVEQAREEDQKQLGPIEVPEFAKQEFVVDTTIDAPVDVVKPVVEPYPNPRIVELQSRIILLEQDRDDLINFVKQNQEDYDRVSDLHTRSMQREVALQTEIDQLSYELHQLNEELMRSKTPSAPIEYTFEEELHEDIPEPLVEENRSVEITKDTQSEIVTDLVGEPLREPVLEADPITQTPPVVVDPKVEEYITDAITKPIDAILTRKPDTGFGADFPVNPLRGDLFLRTDFKPTRLFKWNDIKWIEVNKAATNAYIYNDAYIQFLAEKLGSGEYTIDDLTDSELMQIQNMIGRRRA